MEMMRLVQTMHQKFGVPKAPDTDTANYLFRTGAMHEEVCELTNAILAKDRAEQLDAITDLLVFTFGTADQLSFSTAQLAEAYRRVMGANLAKELAVTSTDSKRGWALDLVKPRDWIPPNLEDLV